jgi:hypothetical protein
LGGAIEREIVHSFLWPGKAILFIHHSLHDEAFLGEKNTTKWTEYQIHKWRQNTCILDRRKFPTEFITLHTVKQHYDFNILDDHGERTSSMCSVIGTIRHYSRCKGRTRITTNLNLKHKAYLQVIRVPIFSWRSKITNCMRSKQVSFLIQAGSSVRALFPMASAQYKIDLYGFLCIEKMGCFSQISRFTL